MINQHSNLLARHNTVIATAAAAAAVATTSNVLSSSNNKTRQAEKTTTSTKDSGMRSSATRELHLTKYFFYQHPELTNTTVAPTETTNNASLITSDYYDTNTIADEEEEDDDEGEEDDYVVREYCCDNEKVSRKINHHIDDYCEADDEVSVSIGVENHYQIDCINDEYGNAANAVEELHNGRNEKQCEYGDKITGNSIMDCKDKQQQQQQERQLKRENLVRCISCQERYCSKNGRQRLQQQVSVNTNSHSIINFRSAISMGSNATNTTSTTTTNTNNSSSSNIGNSDNLSPVLSDSTPTTNSPSNSVSKQQVRNTNSQHCCEPLSNAAASISRCSTHISSSSNTNLTFDHQNQPVQQRNHLHHQHYFHHLHQNQQQFVGYSNNNNANQYISGCKQSCEKTRSLRSISLSRRRNSSPNFDSCQPQHNYLYPQKKPQLSIEEQLRKLLEIDTTAVEATITTTSTDQLKNTNSEQHLKQVEPTLVPTKSCFEATSCHQNKLNKNKNSLAENIRDTIQEKGTSWFSNMKKNSAGNSGKLGGASGRDLNPSESPFGGSSRVRSQPNISPNDRLMIFMLASRSTNTNSTVERNARILKWLNNCKSAG